VKRGGSEGPKRPSDAPPTSTSSGWSASACTGAATGALLPGAGDGALPAGAEATGDGMDGAGDVVVHKDASTSAHASGARRIIPSHRADGAECDPRYPFSWPATACAARFAASGSPR
jgi:hypothetical protein